MKKNRYFNIFILGACAVTLVLSCAKKPMNIGRTNPEVEIKKCMEYSKKKHFKDAVECLEIFKSHFPNSEWGVEAELYIGDNYFRQKEYLLAADSYQTFVKLHPVHPKIDYAFYKSGLSYLKQSPKAIDRDQEYIDDAIANFELVLRNFPDTQYLELTKEYLKDARTRIAKRHYYVAHFYWRTGEYLASIPRFKEIATNYKDSGLADKSLYYIVMANIRLNKLEDAKEAFGELSVNYSGSKYVKEAEGELLGAVK